MLSNIVRQCYRGHNVRLMTSYRFQSSTVTQGKDTATSGKPGEFTAPPQTEKTVETLEDSSHFSATSAPLNDIAEPNLNEFVSQQAPNRVAPWSASQLPREEAYSKYARFQGKDLSKQPRPYSAMELINKQPIRYLEHTNIAVCDGNKGLQGHPRIYINLDPARANVCGYCGLRFAKAEFKDAIEASN